MGIYKRISAVFSALYRPVTSPFSGRDRLKEVSKRLQEYEDASLLSPDGARKFEEGRPIEGRLELRGNHNRATPRKEGPADDFYNVL